MMTVSKRVFGAFITEGAYIRGTYNRGGLYLRDLEPRGLISEGLITDVAYIRGGV